MANYVPKLNQKQFPYNPIANYSHLFRKMLTESDMNGEFGLIGDSSDYINALPQPLLNSIISKNGLQVMVYTCYSSCLATIKKAASSFVISADSWSALVALSGFDSGDEIDCWAEFQDDLALVIQKFGDDATSNKDSDTEDEDEDH